MLSNQSRNPWWPYVLLLAGLFVLSVAVPRGWQRSSLSQRSDDRWSGTQKSTATRHAHAPIAVVRPSRVAAIAPPSAATAPETQIAQTKNSAAAPVTWSEAFGGYAIEAPIIEAVAQKIAELRSFSVLTNPPAKTSAPPTTAAPIKSAASTKTPTTKRNPTANEPVETTPTGWPIPQSLLAQLDHLARHPEYKSWANQARDLSIEVCRNSNSNTQWATECLTRLDSLVTHADSLAGTIEDPHATAELRRAQYSLVRRILIWRPALLIAVKPVVSDVYVDVNAVLTGLERFESSGEARDANQIVDFEQALNTSLDENAKQLSQAIEQVYRNANIRIAISNDLLERLASQGIDSAIRQQTLDSLKNVELEPKKMSSESTAGRVTVRLRVASTIQLGGYTARPQAPSDSLASVQMHESVINNSIDRLQLAGRTYTLPELYQHLAERTKLPGITAPADLPAGVTVTFAKREPIQVRCENGMVRLTLAIADLQQGQKHWRDFSIVAAYAPEITRLHVRLVRQGSIELRGDAMHNQPETALRGLCDRILPAARKLELVPTIVADGARLAGLSITQCVFEDGWMGLALGPFRGGEQMAQRVGSEY